MLLLITWAWAQSEGDAAPCPPLIATPYLPVVGDVDVPPDVQPIVFLDACASSSFQLLDEAGDPVAFTTTSPSPQVLRLVPDAPLAPGLYTLATEGAGYYYGYYGPPEIPWFTVGDAVEAPPTPAAPTFDVEFAYSCGDFTILEAYVDLTFADAAADQRGLLVLDASVDDIHQQGPAPTAYTGQPAVELAVLLPGGRELCVSARLEDLTGAVAWETEQVCGPPPDCPSELDDSGDGGGCGCDGGPGGGIGGAFLLLLARRRRG